MRTNVEMTDKMIIKVFKSKLKHKKQILKSNGTLHKGKVDRKIPEFHVEPSRKRFFPISSVLLK